MDGWRSYDDVAEIYERVHAPRFAEPARDLLALASPAPGARILDIGTGTGVAAEAARVATGDAGFVVGIDVSFAMLSVGKRARPSLRFAAAEAIDLPFPNGTFDTVTGNFVIGHFTKHQTALFDIARVLRPTGRVALSSWADRRDNLQETWLELACSVVPKEVLRSAVTDAYPWGEHFTRRENLEQALLDAGFRHVRTERREYHFHYALEEYVDGLGAFTIGRFVREMLGPPGWESFRARALEAFRQQFADPVNDFREAWLAVGTKP